MAVTVINYTNPADRQFFNLNKQDYPYRQWVNVDLTDDVSFQAIPRSLYIGESGDLEVVGLEGLSVDPNSILSNEDFSYPNGIFSTLVSTDTGVDMRVTINIVPDDINITINEQGYGYTIGDEIIVPGSIFGGTDGVDDISFELTATTSIFKAVPIGIFRIQPKIIVKGGTDCAEIIALY